MERWLCALRPKGREAVVKLLLEAEADVNVKEVGDGRMALYIAAHNGHEAVVKLLLEAEADINVKDNGGWIALYIATEVGHEVVVKLLLEAEADVNVKEIKDGAAALHVAAQGEHEAVVKKLLDSDLSYRGEACQHLDLDLVSLEVKGHFRIRKVLQ